MQNYEILRNIGRKVIQLWILKPMIIQGKLKLKIKAKISVSVVLKSVRYDPTLVEKFWKLHFN